MKKGRPARSAPIPYRLSRSLAAFTGRSRCLRGNRLRAQVGRENDRAIRASLRCSGRSFRSNRSDNRSLLNDALAAEASADDEGELVTLDVFLIDRVAVFATDIGVSANEELE